MSRNIYHPKLEDHIRETKAIPRKIRNGEHLKLYHKYWFANANSSIGKIYDTFIADGIEYYSVKFEGNSNWCIPYPITCDCYELLHNNDNIENINIINNEESYTGAEIKYWFVVRNNIDFSAKKFYGFWSFVDPKSNNVLIDNKYYKVSYDPKRHQKHQIILDKSKL